MTAAFLHRIREYLRPLRDVRTAERLRGHVMDLQDRLTVCRERIEALEAERDRALEVVAMVAKGAPWSDIPPPTCPALDTLAERAPELADDIEHIRNANSQLRYGYCAAHEILKEWAVRARAALGEGK